MDFTNKIEIQGVSKVFGDPKAGFTALSDVNLSVRKGEFVCIVGPSGCGKSTLLRMLAGLETPTGGEIRIQREQDERPLSAMIFQQESAFPWLTVAENAAYGLKATRTWKGAESQERVDYFLEKSRPVFFQILPSRLIVRGHETAAVHCPRFRHQP